LPFKTPASARDRTAADPTLSWLSFLKISPKPGMLLSRSLSATSIVTSRLAIPVPPHTIMESTFREFAAFFISRVNSRMLSDMRTLLATLCPAFDRSDSMRSPDGSSIRWPFFLDAYLEVLQTIMATPTEEGAFSLCSWTELLTDVPLHLSHDSDLLDRGERVLPFLVLLVLFRHVPHSQEVDGGCN